MFNKKKEEEKACVKLKVDRASGTYSQGEWVEGKILVTGIKRKINYLSIQALGAYVPSHSSKSLEACPILGKIGKSNIYEFEKSLISEYVVSGSVKKSFKFFLERKGDNKTFYETYYGFLFAIKVILNNQSMLYMQKLNLMTRWRVHRRLKFRYEIL